MGITLSNQPKTSHDNTKQNYGKKICLTDAVVIRILPNGFSPTSLTVFSGQVICWEWGDEENHEIEHNVRQVTLCDGIPLLVPNGFSSGEECNIGSYQDTIITPGIYHFISDGHTLVRIATIKVVELPTEIVKVSCDDKFLPSFVEVCEGESVTWKWETGTRGSLYRLCYCPSHGSVISSKINFTQDESTCDSHTEYFQDPGIYYFSGVSKETMCVIKVVQRPREFSIIFQDQALEPSYLTANVGDRLWVKNTLVKSECIMMIKAEDGAVLVSSRSTSSMKHRRPNMLSYCFPLPGIYRVTCTLTLTRLCSIVIVKPKPHDYVININKQGFLTGLGSLKQGDRIWWMWSQDDTDKHGFLIQEEEGLPLVDSSSNAPCQCCEEPHLLSSMGSIGVSSLVADTPGLFTYQVKEIGDWKLPGTSLCSIIVQNVPKDHIVQVTDHMFQPQIVNIQPGDTVTWIWRDTMKSHNIQQVSHERLDMDDGFHSSLVSRSPDGFSHVFTDLGVFYYTSSNMCGAYGAVVVTAGNQVHKVEVTLHGVDPDPLGVRVGDMVCWRWSSGQLYSINSIQSPDMIDEIVKNQQVPELRRCFAKIISEPGLHHVVATAYLPDDDDKSLVPSDSFINSIYADHAPYSCRMRVSCDGFQPASVVLAKHDSILWYWDEPDEKHNIVLVENPKGRARPMTVHGPSFFESGKVTRCNSFFHTFDLPGSYWVTSHGTDGLTCRIDVLNEVKRLLAPVIIGGNDGGNVEPGYRVILSCDDNGVQVLYTTDGSQPADYNPATRVYNEQEGICLSHHGFYVIRAFTTKDGWINSRTFTSRRYWVFSEDEQEEIPENQEEMELRQEISNWQWFSCTPFISFFFVYDNVVQIDIGLPKISDLSLIAGFQLYINGVPYGEVLSSSCPGVLVSGLAGQRVYHMVIAVFPNTEQFRPQLSNQIVVSCPALSSIGGPLVSLETCGRVDAVVIVWAANHGCQYTVLINSQPMGGQFFPEPETTYCRVLFEMENAAEEQAFMICVEMKYRDEEQPFYSNEIQLALPLPEDLMDIKVRQSLMHDQELLLDGYAEGIQDPDNKWQIEDLSAINDNHPNAYNQYGQDDLGDDREGPNHKNTEELHSNNQIDDAQDFKRESVAEAYPNSGNAMRKTTNIDLTTSNEEIADLRTEPHRDTDTSGPKEAYQSRTLVVPEDVPEGQTNTPGFTIEPTELIIITELPFDEKQAASSSDISPPESNSYKGGLDTIHEGKQLDIVCNPEENFLDEKGTLKLEKEDNVFKEEDEFNCENDHEEINPDEKEKADSRQMEEASRDNGGIKEEDELEKEDVKEDNKDDQCNGNDDHDVEDGVVSEEKEEDKKGEENQDDVVKDEDKDEKFDGRDDHEGDVEDGVVSEEKEEERKEEENQDDVAKDEDDEREEREEDIGDKLTEENGSDVLKKEDKQTTVKENHEKEGGGEITVLEQKEQLEIDVLKEDDKQTYEKDEHGRKEIWEEKGEGNNGKREDEEKDGNLIQEKDMQNGEENQTDREIEGETMLNDDTGDVIECQLSSQESLHSSQRSSTFSKFLDQLEESLTLYETPAVLETRIGSAVAEEYYCHPVTKDMGYYSAQTVELKDEKRDHEVEKVMNGRIGNETESKTDNRETSDQCNEKEMENEIKEKLEENKSDEIRLDKNESDEPHGNCDEKQRNESELDKLQTDGINDGEEKNEKVDSNLNEREEEQFVDIKHDENEKIDNENTDHHDTVQEKLENEPEKLQIEKEKASVNPNHKDVNKDEEIKEEEGEDKEIDEIWNEQDKNAESDFLVGSETKSIDELDRHEEVATEQNNEESEQNEDNNSNNKLDNKDKVENEHDCQEMATNKEKLNQVDGNLKNEITLHTEVNISGNKGITTKTSKINRNENELPEQEDKGDTSPTLNRNDMNHSNEQKRKEIPSDLQDNAQSSVLFNCQMRNDLKLAVKGTTSNKVVLEWEDTTKVESAQYTVMVFGEKFTSDVDSFERYHQNNSPTPELWPSDQVSLQQHCWTTKRTIIEITGLKARQRYRIAVLVNVVNHGCPDTYLCSEVIPLTMPGRPKAPVLCVSSLEDRKFTICWRTPSSYGEARIVGYQLLINGSQHGDMLPPDTLQHTVDSLQYGSFHHVALTAVTGHAVGDSTPSNVITIACPHPPPPPEVIVHPSTSLNSICVSWQPVSMATDANQLRMLSSYHVFVDDVFHGCCPASDVSDIFQDNFTYTIPECSSGRTYSIHVRGHVDSKTIESSTPAHMCSCYGDKSNILQVRCAEGPCAPSLVLDYMDETRVDLSWEKPTEGYSHGIKGYVLRVDGRIYGNILDPDDTTATLTNLSLGNDVIVSLTALHDQERIDQHHVNMQRPMEGNDSGVESSSSVGIDRRIASANLGPSLSLTLHLWGFVQKVCNVRMVDVSCCAADVRWDVLEYNTCDERNENRHSVYRKPDTFKVTLIKNENFEEVVVMSFNTKNMDVKLADLSPSISYAVTVESFAEHPNCTNGSSNWNVCTSEKLCFKTKPPPLPPQNIKVVYSTLSSICLSWDPINTDNDVRFLHLSVYQVRSDDDKSKIILSFVISSHMTSYTIHGLDSKTQYLFEFRTSYQQDGSDKHTCSTSSSKMAWTSGVSRPHDLHVTKTTPFSLTVAWQPAVTFGSLVVLHYLVHCVEKKSRPAHGSALNTGNTVEVPQGSLLGPLCELKGLEPGASYSILVEAVVKETQEKELEEQTNDVDETASSIGSSESDLMSLVAQDCLSKSITVSTTAPPGKPELLVTGISATQIHLAWNKPEALHLDDVYQANEQELRGRMRQVSGYTLEVNGRVVTRLSADQHNYTVKRCKPGMKYTCYLTVMTTAGDSGGKERRNENNKKKTLSIKTTELTDSEDEQSNDFQETRSDPLEVTIPRQDPPLVLKLYYNPTSTHVSTSSSGGSDESDEGCVVLQWKSSTPLKGVVSYRVRWVGALEGEEEKEENLLASATRCEINRIKPRSVYSVWLNVTRTDGATISYGPLRCQVPGRPDCPWIWCRSVSSYRVLVEWNEPRTYGIDTIRAYQINLNGRQLGKPLNLQTRKAAVHCQPNSVYRISIMALSADPNLGDAEPSNVLTVCTPGVAKKDLDPKQNIRLKPLWAENNSLTVEWSDDNDLLTVDHYVIKWSSVRHPESREDSVPVEETSYCIGDCIPGTRHFIAVAAVNDQGKLVSKSSQLIMQTSAPLAAPELREYSALPYSIIVGWDKPVSIGDASVDSYQIKVNDEVQAILDSSELSFEFTDCSPCEEYVFHIKTLSTKDDCHSDWSAALSIVCPGAWQPEISRGPSDHVNCIHVTWITPKLFGGAEIDNYKVHYLTSTEKSVSLETLLDSEETITHGPLQSTSQDDSLTDALPSEPYWVVLEVTLLPDGCITVFSQPIKTQVAIPPDPPWIRVHVVGLKERKTLERFLCRLAQLKDRISRKVTLLQNTVIVKGSKQKEIQVTKHLATLRNLDIELGNCVRDVTTHTGTLTAELSWARPRDDDDAVITGYQVFINQQKHGQPLDEKTRRIDVKIPASLCDHVVTVKSLTSHPIGHSAPSSQVTLQTRDFLPFVQFCYFSVHSESRGCCYGDNLNHEIKNKQISTHRGTLGKPLPSPVCYVMDIVGSSSQPLIQSSSQAQVVLFWTPWCQSSIKALEMLMQFAHSHNSNMDFTTCCVQSNQPVSGHYQALHAQLKLHDWLTNDVKHMCGCHPVGQRSVLRRNEGGGGKASVSHTFGLVGVPTIVLCNTDDYMVWQGRIFAQDFNEFQQFLLHALNESLSDNCTIPDCDQCLLDNELDTTGLTSHLVHDPMDDYYNYKSANYDPSLVVTGCLSRSSLQPSNDVGQSTDFKHSDSSLTENVHSITIENTDFLRRRLHDSRPQTSKEKLSSSSLISRAPKLSCPNMRFSNEGRAKTANQTRSSVFQNRFSSSMTSSLPSLGLTNERSGPNGLVLTNEKPAYKGVGLTNERPDSKRQRPFTTKAKKVKISVDEFSPV